MSELYENAPFTRKIITRRDDNYILVQDFYPSGEKRSDPFWTISTNTKPNFYGTRGLADQERIISYYPTGQIEQVMARNVDILVITSYYSNGQKAEIDQANLSTSNNSQHIKYYTTGQKFQETNVQEGLREDKQWHLNDQLSLYQNATVSKGWYENGQLCYEMPQSNGIPHGIYSSWHSNGQLQQQGNYDRDEREGLWTSWYDNGQIKLKAPEQHNQPNGRWLLWHENGKKAAEFYYQAGKAEGLAISYYDNGNRQFIEHFSGGRKLGKTISYHPTKPEIYCQLDNGQGNGATGHWLQWHSNGQPHIECDFTDGLKQGTWSVWYKNGQLEQQGQFMDDIPVGLWRYWFENGQLARQNTFAKNPTPYANAYSFNLYDFPWHRLASIAFYNNHNYMFIHRYESYHENGQIHCAGHYDNQGKTQGLWQYWYLNGQLQRAGHYKNSQPLGNWRYWSAQGQLVADYYCYIDPYARIGIAPLDEELDLD